MGVHKSLVNPAMAQQQMAHTTEKGEVGAGMNRKMQIGRITGCRGPRVNNHKAKGISLFALALQQALK